MYDPSRDLMLTIVMYHDDGVQNVLRLIVSSGDAIAKGSWSYIYDWVSPSGTFFDFPDMCLSNNRLWFTTNRASIATQAINDAYMMSISLDELKAGGTLHYSYIDSNTAGWANIYFRCTRGASGIMYWASHNNNTQIRIFKWIENDTSVSFLDVNLAPAWNDSIPRRCPGPDGLDWCGHVQGYVTGAWVAKGIIGFMWTASQGGSFPFPYVEVLRLNESDLTPNFCAK
jgi:hypothetical protein